MLRLQVKRRRPSVYKEYLMRKNPAKYFYFQVCATIRAIKNKKADSPAACKGCINKPRYHQLVAKHEQHVKCIYNLYKR